MVTDGTEPSYRPALLAEPQATTDIAARLRQAVAAHKQGAHSVAQAGYEEVLRLQPAHFDALHLLGVIALQRMDTEAGIDLIRQALDVNPRHASAHLNMGTGLSHLRRWRDALASFDRAIALKPGLAEAYASRGHVLTALKRPDEAVVDCDRAIELKPDFADAYNNRGLALRDLGRLAEALASCDRAIALKPDFADAYNTRGIALQALNRPDEALASYNQAIALKPDFARAFSNRGGVFVALKRLDEALVSFENAVANEPDFAEWHWNEGLCRLLMGDFERGWQKYEWRWRKDSFTSPKRQFPQRPWLGGEAIQGKTMLLHAEQGLGDTIQFCRYAGLVAAQGATVLLAVQSTLKSLLSSLKGVDRILAEDEPLPAFDFHCPLLSLPLAFGTRVETIPAAVPYLFSDRQKVVRWRTRLGDKAAPRVAIVWAGGTKHKDDHNRSLPLSRLIQAIPPQVSCYSVQKEVRASDREVLRRRRDIIHLGDDLEDFADTAALVSQMDVVISVDTAVAHLAGALGKPVWVLLPFSPDWRWLLNREDSPWYPGARLFRQPAIGDWDTVLSRVRKALSELTSDETWMT